MTVGVLCWWNVKTGECWWDGTYRGVLLELY
jgi:hypothetical protein